MRKLFLSVMITAVVFSFSAAQAGKNTPAGVFFPLLRVPVMSQPPKIDGKLEKNEWDQAAVFTGVCGNPLGKEFLLPEAQQVLWYLGFHQDTLYIGLHSLHPKGTYPAGRVKQHDDPDVLWGDHVEIQILTQAREDAGKPGKGFYKMVVNALGAMHDSHYFNGTPGTEDLWSTGGEVKCSVTDEYWQMELSVKAEAIRLKQFDGNTIVMQLVRAADTGGLYFAGWVGTSWMDWQRFGEVSFDSQSPVFRLIRLGEIMEGNLDARVEIRGRTQQPQQVVVRFLVADADSRILYQEEQTASVSAGQSQTLSFKKSSLPVSEVELEGKRNLLEVYALWREGKKETVLFHHRMPFMKLTQAWKAKYWDPWVARRPQAGEWETVFAYLPYSARALAKVDVDFFGIPEKIRSASRFTVEVRKKGEKKALVSVSEKVVQGAGEVFFALPELADGQYEALFRLYASNGELVAEKTES
ncbi:MAG: hypothetical protein NC823_02130, partial [Candidatus Omnitrophica bacterium]|nr:hypothetical protein [Candidatus Omnitrophota bacterium]